jgi:hypothetical protein
MSLLIPAAVGLYVISQSGKNRRIDLPPPSGQPPSVTGIPAIETKKLWINRALNTVKFDINFPDGEVMTFRERLKKGDKTIKLKNGQFWLLVDVMQAIDKKGRPDPMGAVMIVLMDNKKRPIAGKRIIMGTKQIIDVL